MIEKIKIFTEDAVWIKDKIYFFSRYWNALYAVNIKLGITEFISIMPEEDITAVRLCAGIMYYNEKLILVPMTAKKIWIYDLKKNSWKGLERKYMTDGNPHKEMFRAIEYKNNFFLVGSNYPGIIRLNPDNYELEYLRAPYAFLESVKSESECYFRTDHLLVGNHLFLASCLNHFVLCLDLDTFDFKWLEVGERGFQYSGIAWDGEYYWLSPRRGTPVIKWDGKDKTEYFSLPDGFDCNTYNFSGVQYDDGKLVFPGMLQARTILIDPEHPYDMEILKERYTFYRCSERGMRLSQTADGILQWKHQGQSRSEQIPCEIFPADLTEYIRAQSRKKTCRKIESEILAEFPSALILYILMVEQGTGTGKRKSEIGETIWRTTRS